MKKHFFANHITDSSSCSPFGSDIIDEKAKELFDISDHNDQLKWKIKERMETEKKLWQSEQLYRSLAEIMNDGLLVCDKNSSIIYLNDKLCQMLGYTRDEIIEHPIIDLLDETNQTILKEQWAKRKIGVDNAYELTFTVKDGQKITTIISPKSIFDADGYFKGSLSVITDITKRKEAEELLKRQALELARSNAELEQFTYVVSHDLQEPLRKIRAFGDRLKAKCDNTLNDRCRNYLEHIQNAAKRMQTLINDLLTFSRVTKRDQLFASVDLGKVVHESLSNLEMLIEQTKGHVEVDNLPNIEADQTQMCQLMQNLIGNALKFHRQEEAPVVKIYGQLINGQEDRSARKLQVDQFCQIFVEDNGIGFDEKYLDLIFGVFQRLHGHDNYDGTGIGLANCRKIVEYHGGSITAKSTPGKGSTFVVTLPVKQAKNES